VSLLNVERRANGEDGPIQQGMETLSDVCISLLVFPIFRTCLFNGSIYFRGDPVMRCGMFIAMAAAFSLFTISSVQANFVNYMTTWSGIGSVASGVDVDASGNVYVVSSGGNSVEKYNSSGVSQQSFTGSLSVPTDVAVSSDGSVYVTNVGSSQCVKYSSGGTVAASWSCGLSVSLATDSSGNVYVADIGGGLKKYDSNGGLLNTWSIPTDASGLALNASGTIAYTTSTAATNNFYAVDLATGGTTTLGTLVDTSDRCSIDVNKATGNIYVNSRTTNCIQEFASDGTLVKQWNTWSDAGSEATYSAAAATSSGYRGIAFDATTNNIYACNLALVNNMLVFHESVPEPGTIVLMSTGLIGLLAYAWRKRK
jgi:hypothetical protein